MSNTALAPADLIRRYFELDYAVSKQDRTTSPELERFLAERMKAKTIELDSGHLSLITHPRQITELILRAARDSG